MSRSKEKKEKHKNQDNTKPVKEAPNADPDSPSVSDSEYSLYRDHRKILWDAEYESGKRFDQWLITVSGGALAISMTFIKDILGAAPPRSSGLILLSWMGFGAAVALTLGSILLSQRGFEKFREDLDTEFDSQESNALRRAYERHAKRWTPSLIHWFNRVSIGLFVIALGLLCRFAYVNLTEEEHAVANRTTSQRSDK